MQNNIYPIAHLTVSYNPKTTISATNKYNDLKFLAITTYVQQKESLMTLFNQFIRSFLICDPFA